MEATFSDPQGPALWRRLPYLAPLLLVGAAITVVPGTMPTFVTMTLGGILFNALGLVGFRQRRPRRVTIECGPGVVFVKGAGTRTQKLVTKSIVGATTARTKGGFVVTLQHAKRDQPITIEVATEAEAEQIRRALGIGHGGFGTLTWQTTQTHTARTAFIGRILAVMSGLIVLLLAALSDTDTWIAFGILLGVLGAVGAFLGLGELVGHATTPSVVMTAEGLRIYTVRGWFTMPYSAILGVQDHRRALVFATPPPYNAVSVETTSLTFGGLADADRQNLAAQVDAAALRARGLGPPKEDVSGRIDVLRRQGENVRDWLVRLDMQGQMLSAAPGYRGGSLEPDDLWRILEDPEADAELRTAAARVLRHAPQPETRVRIDAAVAAVRDEGVNKRLRIAMSDDLDDASQELAVLEANEASAAQKRMMMPPSPFFR